ncbi:MAG: hypothetical protein ACLPQ0_15265 [Candidatus Binatus sp.]
MVLPVRFTVSDPAAVLSAIVSVPLIVPVDCDAQSTAIAIVAMTAAASETVFCKFSFTQSLRFIRIR